MFKDTFGLFYKPMFDLFCNGMLDIQLLAPEEPLLRDPVYGNRRNATVRHFVMLL